MAASNQVRRRIERDLHDGAQQRLVSLANVAKHAHASVVQVGAEVRDGALRVLVRDDGIGGADPSRGSGLISLTNRVEALGGTIDISSHADAGTRILAEFPASDS